MVARHHAVVDQALNGQAGRARRNGGEPGFGRASQCAQSAGEEALSLGDAERRHARISACLGEVQHPGPPTHLHGLAARESQSAHERRRSRPGDAVDDDELDVRLGGVDEGGVRITGGPRHDHGVGPLPHLQAPEVVGPAQHPRRCRRGHGHQLLVAHGGTRKRRRQTGHLELPEQVLAP